MVRFEEIGKIYTLINRFQYIRVQESRYIRDQCDGNFKQDFE
jgi:hypothetical protein